MIEIYPGIYVKGGHGKELTIPWNRGSKLKNVKWKITDAITPHLKLQKHLLNWIALNTYSNPIYYDTPLELHLHIFRRNEMLTEYKNKYECEDSVMRCFYVLVFRIGICGSIQITRRFFDDIRKCNVPVEHDVFYSNMKRNKIGEYRKAIEAVLYQPNVELIK